MIEPTREDVQPILDQVFGLNCEIFSSHYGVWIDDVEVAKLVGRQLRPTGWSGAVGGRFLELIRLCLREMADSKILDESEVGHYIDRGFNQGWETSKIYRRLGVLESLARVKDE